MSKNLHFTHTVCWKIESENDEEHTQKIEREKEAEQRYRAINSTNLISSHEACGQRCEDVYAYSMSINARPKLSLVCVRLFHGWTWTFSSLTVRCKYMLHFRYLAKNAMDG